MFIIFCFILTRLQWGLRFIFDLGPLYQTWTLYTRPGSLHQAWIFTPGLDLYIRPGSLYLTWTFTSGLYDLEFYH